MINPQYQSVYPVGSCLCVGQRASMQPLQSFLVVNAWLGLVGKVPQNATVPVIGILAEADVAHQEQVRTMFCQRPQAVANWRVGVIT